MSIDLESSLDQLARSVHDDAVTARMDGQVHRMVSQIRRRRAARYTATGVVSVGAVAAVAIAALQLGDPEAQAPVAPATEGSDGDVSYDVTGLDGRYVCGEVAPEAPEAPDAALILEGQVSPDVAYGDPVPLELTLLNMLSMSVDSYSDVGLVVLSDGVVVGTSELGASAVGLVPGTDPAGQVAPTIVACAGDTPLDEGEYEMVASITLALADGTSRTAVTEPMPFTIGANPLNALAEDAAELARAAEEGRMAVEEIIAASAEVSAQYPFGVCGTAVPATTSDLLEIEMELASLSYSAGDLMEGTSAITARAGLTVLGNAPITAAHVVLVRDGVVVGRGDYDPEYIDLLTFTPDRPYPLPALGNALLCSLPGADAPELDLPSGVYQAYATLEVALKEVQYADGTAESRSDTIVVRSDPVDVVIDTPAS